MMQLKLIRIVTIWLLLIFADICSFAQNPAMKHYDISDGLAGNMVYSICNDKKGFIWFATEAGVSLFDGNKFRNFSIPLISANEVLSIKEDSKGRIWLLGFNGTLSYYYNGAFFTAANDTVLKKAVSTTSFRRVFEDNQNRLWFVADNEYVVIEGKNVRRIDNNFKKELKVEGIVMNSKVYKGIYLLTHGYNNNFDNLHLIFDNKDSIYQSRFAREINSGYFYLADSAILYCTDKGIVWQKDTVQKLVLPKNKEFDHVNINSIFVSSDNRLWIGTIEKGVFCYDYNNLSKPPERYLVKESICDIEQDMEGNIWISTSAGVNMFAKEFRNIKNYDAIAGLPEKEIFSVTKEKNNIYIGMLRGQAAVINNGVIKLLNLPLSNVANNRIIKIIIKGKNLWMGSDECLLHLKFPGKTFSKLQGKSTSSDKLTQMSGIKDLCLNNDILSACSSHGIYNIKGTDLIEQSSPLEYISKDSRRTYSVYVDNKGTLWYGAQGGLFSYDGITTKCHSFDSITSGVRISSIAGIGDSILVIGTYGYGLFICSHDKMLEHLSMRNGLPGNICRKIFVYKDEIYVATNEGFSLFEYKNGRSLFIKKYTVNDGILNNSINDIFADSSEICLATYQGLSVIDRKSFFDFPVSPPPPLYITRILNNYNGLNPDSNYTFSFTQNNFRFEYVAISYLHPEGIVYQFKLNDEEPWAETKNTTLNFFHLQPGKYHFQLRAKILNGLWTRPRSLYFLIKQPYWKTYWFIALCIVLFSLFILIISNYIFRVVNRNRLEKIEMKEQMMEMEQMAMQALMNPHFIFNVMNSIQHYINVNDKYHANIYLENFAQLIRMNLEIASKKYISVEEGVAFLEMYLSLESLRFGNKLSYKINVDPAIDFEEPLIPIMLIQPFVENAIWHGILPKKEGGHIQVNITKQRDGMLKVQIIDNGIGMQITKETTSNNKKAHISFGMEIAKKRIELIGKKTGHNLSIHIADAFPGEEYKGTKIEFFLPEDID